MLLVKMAKMGFLTKIYLKFGKFIGNALCALFTVLCLDCSIICCNQQVDEFVVVVNRLSNCKIHHQSRNWTSTQNSGTNTCHESNVFSPLVI
jgi:hypothetical protein